MVMQSTPVRTGITTPILYASVVRLLSVSITPGRTLSDYLRHTLVNYTFPSLIMSKSVMFSLLNRAADGNQLLAVLDSLVEDITQENIDECAAHYAAISTPTLEAIAF